MKFARLAGMMIVAILAMSLVAVSAAFAAPEFKPSTKTAFTGTSGTGTLSANNGSEKVICAKDTSKGEIVSATLAGSVIVTFSSCKSESATKEVGKTCTAKSVGAAEGTIVTTTLHGVLGLILPKPASGSDVALVLLPISGKRFVTLAGNSCTEETAVTGSIGGLVEPVGTPSTTGKLVFGVTSGKQNITEVDLSTGGTVKPALTAFSTTATEQTTEELSFGTTKVEVT